MFTLLTRQGLLIFLFIIMVMNRTLNFPILAFQIWLLSPGGDLHSQIRSFDDSISIWGMCRDNYLRATIPFRSFFRLSGSLLVFTGIPGGSKTPMFSRSYLTYSKILRARNKHNVRYYAIVKWIAKMLPRLSPMG